MEMYIILKYFRLFSLAIVSLLVQNGFSQVSPEVGTYRNLFPNAHTVRLNQATLIDISIKDGEVDIIQEIVEEDLYLDESATHKSNRSVTFSSFFEMQEMEASSFVFDKNKYKEFKVEEFREKDELEHSFHDDARSVNFIFPSLKAGSKSRLKYSERIKNPRFLNPFFFADYFPIVQNKFQIKVDKEIELRFLKFNFEDVRVTFKEEEKWGKRIYTWETDVVKEYYHEDGTPNYRSFLPHIIPIISSYTYQDKTVNVLEDVSDLYKWYYSLIQNINKDKPDSGLVELVEELTRNKETDLEKVRAIYYWTQQNIKYIDYEYGLGGFIPREANVIFKKKYGDCKDNSSILQQMLSIANIEGQITWIGTRSIPYTYNEVPTPMVDNHMILSYIEDDQVYFLDATGRFMPLEVPSYFIQGKEALVALGPEEYKIVKVPVVPARENAVVENNYIELKGDRIIGKTNAQLTGYNRIELFQHLETVNSPDKLKEYYKDFFQKGSNKFLISDFNEVNKFDYSNEYKLSYNFTIEDYANNIGDEIYLNLNLNRELLSYRVKDSRKTDMEMKYKHYFRYTTNFKIPEGYEVEYMPAGDEFNNEFIKARVEYNREKDMIIYSHEIELDFLLLDKEAQKQVNALIDQVEQAYKEVIILKKL